MAMRLPKSERLPSPSPLPPPDQREAIIQELTRGSELAALLRQQLELIPELDRRDDALANVRDISMSLRSSISALRFEREHCGSSSGAGAAVSSVSDGGGGGGGRNRKTKHRRGRHDGELIKKMLTTTPENDGFHWRKYGEKNILNTDFPKLYYRCGYSDERKCRAKKYVQQENKKHPPEFMVTLINEHTCNTLFPNQPSSSSTSQVLDFTKAYISSPMNTPISAPILKEEEEEVPSIDESRRIMSTTTPSYEAYDYNELSPQSWDGVVWQ